MRYALKLTDVQDDVSEVPLRAGTAPAFRRFKQLLAQLQRSRETGDGQLILLTEEAADLATMPGNPDRAEALLELASGDPWQICLTVSALARKSGSLDEGDLFALVDACSHALETVPLEDQEGLLEDLAAQGHHRFLRAELEHSLEMAPPNEVAWRFASGLKRLPPSIRVQLDLDALIERCLERMGPAPLAAWLDHLLQTVALRDLEDDGLRDRLAGAWVNALEPADVTARHRDRLFYLSKYAITPVTRARVLARLDLARLAALPRDNGDPELVLENLASFPGVLAEMPETEAQLLIAFVLRRLFRHLSDDDHLRIGRRLCAPSAPEPFFAALRAHLRHLTARASLEVQLEVFGAFFSAWLSPRAIDLAPVVRPLLTSVAHELERELKQHLGRHLKRRFGDAFQQLLQEEAPDGSSWRSWWPFGAKGGETGKLRQGLAE